MIITTIEQLKAHIATIVGDDIAIYSTYLKTAEKFLFREILSAALEDYLSDEAELLELAQAVVAHKAYLEAIPFLDLVQTNSGFAVVSNDNLAPASTARVNSLLSATAVRLSECIEDLLEWLEESADPTIESIWKASKTYTLINDNYIRSIRQFREYGEFTGNRLDWIAFKPHLVTARKLFIEPVISVELSTAIIETMRDDDDVPAPMKAILDDLRFALAAFATNKPEIANSYLARVRSYLIAHVDDFPSFKASDIYVKYLATVARDTSADPFLICGV